MSAWGSFPTWWVKARLLKQLDAHANTIGTHIAALKLYLAIALLVDFNTRAATLTYDELIEWTNLSRPMLRPGLTVLEETGVLRIVREYRHRYEQVTLIDDPRFMKIPKARARKALRSLPNRGASVLAALKIYLTLLHVRDSRGIAATISHEKMQDYTGVRPNKIRSGVDHLVAHDLVHVRQNDERSTPGRPVHTYDLRGLFDPRGFDAQEVERGGNESAALSGQQRQA